MADSPIDFYVPDRVNAGTFVAGQTYAKLEERIDDAEVILPICSVGTAPDRLAALGPLVLPPLYHEALTPDLKDRIIERVRTCFPYYAGSDKRAKWRGRLTVAELPRKGPPSLARPRVLAFSVDTAVEEHGPHLPLATDTVESYSVLRLLAKEFDGFVVGPPADYGHLTWGLAFGMSVDLTPALTRRYVTGFVNAMMDWLAPEALYVVDTHGSQAHRQAIQEGLSDSRCSRHIFRWVFEPMMAQLAADRGDFHAGGIETAVMESIDPALLDNRWWPSRVDELAAREMTVETAVDLASNLQAFIQHAQDARLNGIVGTIRHYFEVNGSELRKASLDLARTDVEQLVIR